MKPPKIFKLPSGATTILLKGDFPLTTVLILVKTGTDYESKQNNGIAHFIEHMFFKGTKNYPDPNILALELDKIGADYNAFTSYEYTGFYVKTPPEFTEKSIELLSDMLKNPIFDKKEIEKERGVILQEIKFIHDTPQYYIFDEGLKLLYGDQPAGWPIIGEESVIKKINKNDLIDYFYREYINKKMIIIVVGNFHEEKILNIIKKHFNQKQKSKIYKKSVVDNYQNKIRKRIIQRKDIKQTHVLLLFRSDGILKLKEKRFARKLMTSILGYGFSSRIFKILRQEYGLTYYLKVDEDLYTDRGYFYIQFGCDLDKLNFALSKVIEEIQKIKKEKIQEEEIEKSKIILKNDLLTIAETSMNLALYYGSQYLYFNKIYPPEESIKKIERLDEKDVKTEANLLFSNRNLNYVIISSYPKEKMLVKISKI